MGFLRIYTLVVCDPSLAFMSIFKELISLNPSPPLISKEEKPTEGDFVHTKRKGRGEERRDRSVRQKLKLRCIHATTTTIVLTIFFVYFASFLRTFTLSKSIHRHFSVNPRISPLCLRPPLPRLLCFCTAMLQWGGGGRRGDNYLGIGAKSDLVCRFKHKGRRKLNQFFFFSFVAGFSSFAAADVTI